MSRSQEYIQDIIGCSYSYQMVMASGAAVPNYFEIESDGSITFINAASNKFDEYIGIVITASDDFGNVESYQTDYFQLESVCCVDST